MTQMDESKAASFEAFCPLTAGPATAAAGTTASTSSDTAAAQSVATLTAGGAYTDDALRIVRGTPNAEELAALVAALLLTRRAHDRNQSLDQTYDAPREHGAAYEHSAADQHDTAHDQAHHRPSWLRAGYTPPGSWTARP